MRDERKKKGKEENKEKERKKEGKREGRKKEERKMKEKRKEKRKDNKIERTCSCLIKAPCQSFTSPGYENEHTNTKMSLDFPGYKWRKSTKATNWVYFDRIDFKRSRAARQRAVISSKQITMHCPESMCF